MRGQSELGWREEEVWSDLDASVTTAISEQLRKKHSSIKGNKRSTKIYEICIFRKGLSTPKGNIRQIRGKVARV